jgi:hypothetical protein
LWIRHVVLKDGALSEKWEKVPKDPEIDRLKREVKALKKELESIDPFSPMKVGCS